MASDAVPSVELSMERAAAVVRTNSVMQSSKSEMSRRERGKSNASRLLWHFFLASAYWLSVDITLCFDTVDWAA